MPEAVSDSVKHVTFAAPAYVPVLRASEPLVGAYASIAELNQLSAPIKGNGGVFVLQPYAFSAPAIAFVQLYSYLCKDKMERLIDNYAETNSFRTDTH